ncbi:MAG: hypothetical protein JWN70_6336 [Planctomycetaceae bacterium]|nr:hypothetical protein [Planctomycetaceae bacterium]
MASVDFRGTKRDRSRINLNANDDRMFWSKRFGITSEQLIEIVLRAGSSPDDVQKVLRQQHSLDLRASRYWIS